MAAVRTIPARTTAGKVDPTGPSVSKRAARSATTSATAAGVEGCGVGTRWRSATSCPCPRDRRGLDPGAADVDTEHRGRRRGCHAGQSARIDGWNRATGRGSLAPMAHALDATARRAGGTTSSSSAPASAGSPPPGTSGRAGRRDAASTPTTSTPSSRCCTRWPPRASTATTSRIPVRGIFRRQKNASLPPRRGARVDLDARPSRLDRRARARLRPPGAGGRRGDQHASASPAWPSTPSGLKSLADALRPADPRAAPFEQADARPRPPRRRRA